MNIEFSSVAEKLVRKDACEENKKGNFEDVCPTRMVDNKTKQKTKTFKKRINVYP
jgi:hypothetical protein